MLEFSQNVKEIQWMQWNLCSMNCGLFKYSVSYLCLDGTVVASWYPTQEVAGLNPFNNIRFVTEFNKFHENLLWKVRVMISLEAIWSILKLLSILNSQSFWYLYLEHIIMSLLVLQDHAHFTGNVQPEILPMYRYFIHTQDCWIQQRFSEASPRGYSQSHICK